MKFAPPSLLSLAVTMSMIVLLTTLFASADSSFTAIMDGTSRPDVPALMLQKFSIPTDRTVVNSLTLRGSYYFVNFVFVDNANTCQMGQPTGSSGSFNPSEFPSSFNPSEFPSSFNPSEFPSSFNPSEFPSDFNPSEFPSSFNPSEFPSSFNPSEFPSDFNPSEFPSSFNPSEFPSDFNPSEFPSDFNPSEFPSDFGAERKMEAQDTCPMPTTSNYSTTNTAILNYVISNLSPSILHSTGFLEIWSGNDGSEPTAMTLDLAEYTITPRPSMGYGYAGGLGVHVQSGNILGSVCATGMLSVDTTAATQICVISTQATVTKAAFFGGALTTGGFIAVGSLSSTLEASVYNNFTYKGDQCGNHGNDLGIICGSDVFTTSDAAMSGSTITYTVTTPNPTLVGQFIETVSLGLIPASGLIITTTTTTAVFSVKEGHMGFTKLDLDGVLQSMSPLAWSLGAASATDFTWDIDVVFKTHNDATTTQQATSTSATATTTTDHSVGTQTTTLMTTSISGTTTTATSVMTTMGPGQGSSSSTAATSQPTGQQSTTATSQPAGQQSTTATSQPAGQQSTATTSQTTDQPGSQGGGTTTTQAAPTNAPTTTPLATTSTATTMATTTMATTTLAPKTKLDVIVEDNMTATALETAIRGIAATANASFTVTCATPSGNSGSSKKCIVEFTSSSDAAIVESEANNDKMSGVMSASNPDDASNDDSDDNGGNTTLIIIVVVVAVVVLVGIVAAVVIVKSRGGSGMGQSFMDMEQEMALNEPMEYHDGASL